MDSTHAQLVHIIQNLWLPGGIFAAVCMATIDHQGTGSIDIAKVYLPLVKSVEKLGPAEPPAKSTDNRFSGNAEALPSSISKGLALSGGNDAVYRCLQVATGDIFNPPAWTIPKPSDDESVTLRCGHHSWPT